MLQKFIFLTLVCASQMYPTVCIDAHSSYTSPLDGQESCNSANINWVQDPLLANSFACGFQKLFFGFQTFERILKVTDSSYMIG